MAPERITRGSAARRFGVATAAPSGRHPPFYIGVKPDDISRNIRLAPWALQNFANVNWHSRVSNRDDPLRGSRPESVSLTILGRNQTEIIMQTILITGCSSGYGLETARHFLANGWNVIATMRTPREHILPRSESLRVLPLDVTSEDSIAAADEAAGPIDALVNNAGIGVVGAFEATPMAGVYTASKTAIEGLTGSVAFELAAFNIRVKLVEPGYGPTMAFTSNGESRMAGLIPEAYAPFAEPIFAAFAQPAAVTTEADVAEVVWRAANDLTGQLRFPAGPDAVALAEAR
jgi:NAD(P)-dependent dehydrogenase (short-subunit alcohol dehydrogenase family)